MIHQLGRRKKIMCQMLICIFLKRKRKREREKKIIFQKHIFHFHPFFQNSFRFKYLINNNFYLFLFSVIITPMIIPRLVGKKKEKKTTAMIGE